MTSGRAFTEEQRHDLVRRICELMSEGMFMSHACKAVGTSRWTINNWREQDKSITQMLDAAWELGIEALAADQVQIADTPNLVTTETVEKDAKGNVVKRTSTVQDNVHRDRLRVYAREKAISVIMSRLPKRKDQGNTPANGSSMSPDDRTEYTEAQLDYIIEHGELPPDQPTEETTP